MAAAAQATVSDIFRAAVRRTEDEPAWFYENILRMPAQDWQIEATEAVFDVRRKAQGKPTKVNHAGRPRISIRSCHGPGKTHFLAMLSHAWSFTTPGLIAATAPKEAQLRRRLWPRFRKCLSHASQAYRDQIKVTATEVMWYGDPDWGMVAETASDPDNLSGYHDTPQLFLVDEASAKRLDPMFPVIEGALTTPGSVKVEIGNPTRTEGEFWAHHCKAGTRDLYYRMHIRPEDAPQYVSPDWVEAMAAKYGVESPVFKVRVLGEFAALDEYQLIPLEWVEDWFDWIEKPDGSLPRLRVTVDVADGGADSTVVTVARHYDTYMQVLSQRQYYFPQSKSPIMAAGAAKQAFLDYRQGDEDGDIVVDAMGVGAGTAGTLMTDPMLKQIPIIAYKGGETVGVDTTRFRNRRVQSYIALWQYAKDQKIRISPDAIDDAEEFRAHVCSVRRRMNAERVDDLEPKEMFRRLLLPSPDRGDSLAMQLTTQTPQLAGSVGEVEVVGHSELDDYDAGLT